MAPVAQQLPPDGGYGHPHSGGGPGEGEPVVEACLEDPPLGYGQLPVQSFGPLSHGSLPSAGGASYGNRTLASSAGELQRFSEAGG